GLSVPWKQNRRLDCGAHALRSMKSEGTMKIKAAIIGSGNIGTDLMIKAMRSQVIEPVWMVGIDPNSDGLRRARALGLKTTDKGVDGLLPRLAEDGIRIAFDASSAHIHPDNSRKLTERDVIMIDLTPAAIGPFCIPPVNLERHIGESKPNVNMVS